MIGGGAGGLTAAPTLAQQGARTLLLEKNPVVGGYAHGGGEQGFSWDHGGHVLLAYRLGSAARQVFERLGIDRRIEMVPDRQTFQCVFPDARTEIPADLTMAAERLSRQYPAERAGITRLLLDMERMVAELDTVVPSFRIADPPGKRRPLDQVLEQFQRPWPGDAVAPLAGRLRLPRHTLLRYLHRTLQQMLDEHLRDPDLTATLPMLCVGIGTAPSEHSAVIAAVFRVHALRPMWMPEGGFGRLAEVFREMCLDAGGTVVTGAEVERVLVSGGRARGVRTSDGRQYGAGAVVCASDARSRTSSGWTSSTRPGTLTRPWRTCRWAASRRRPTTCRSPRSTSRSWPHAACTRSSSSARPGSTAPASTGTATGRRWPTSSSDAPRSSSRASGRTSSSGACSRRRTWPGARATPTVPSPGGIYVDLAGVLGQLGLLPPLGLAETRWGRLGLRVAVLLRSPRRGGRGPRAWLGGAASEDADGPPPLA